MYVVVGTRFSIRNAAQCLLWVIVRSRRARARNSPEFPTLSTASIDRVQATRVCEQVARVAPWSGSRTTSPADPSASDYRATRQMCWRAALAPPEEPRCPRSCSPCTPPTADSTRGLSPTHVCDESSIVSCITDNNREGCRALVRWW